MAEFAGGLLQNAGSARSIETVQCVGTHLPDFADGQNVLGRPQRQCGKHVQGVAIKVVTDVAHASGPIWMAICARVLMGVSSLQVSRGLR